MCGALMWVDHKFDQLGVAGFPKYIEPVIKTAQNPHVKSTINKFLHSSHNVTRDTQIQNSPPLVPLVRLVRAAGKIEPPW